MPHFLSDGISLHYIDEGAGEPVLLIHGFASNIEINWVGPGWTDFLVKAGRRVIAFDHRGHGKSDKLYDPLDYGAPLMAEDARRLLDHLGIERVDAVGYSMGARVSAFLAHSYPGRVRSAVFGGMGSGMLSGLAGSEVIASALEAPSREGITDPTARMFRVFAEATKGDLKALSACMRSQRSRVTPEMLAELRLPVLIAVGTLDDVSGPAEGLARYLPNAEVLDIPGRDHNRAVGDKVFKEGVLDFLGRRA